MWVRGLKLIHTLYNFVVAIVAPHVGAWIETQVPWWVPYGWRVAPHVGAWIETNLLVSAK